MDQPDENVPLVLVVDDNPVNCELLAIQLDSLGMQTEQADNGKAALDKWLQGKFALIITDCQMPEIDGFELTRRIRQIEAEKKLVRTPVLAWTGNAAAEELENCRAAGMDELLVKPVELSRLSAALEKWIKGEAVDAGSPAPAMTHDTEQNMAQFGLIDFSVLEEMLPDKSEHGAVLRDFLMQIRKDFSALSEALEQGDPITASRLSHRMKGSCRMVGATGLSRICADIEQAARNNDTATARAACPALADQIEQLAMSI